MGTIPAHQNEFPSLLFAEGAAPATPAAGLVVCYAKADGLLYCKDDAGVETAYAAAATDLAAHLADAADAHDASAISVADAGAVFTGTDVEAVLAELQAAIAGGGIPATLLDAQGDLIVASAADTAARLAIGAAGTYLRSTGSTAAWAAPPGNAWKMSLSTSQTLTNNTDTVITFDRADIDGGGSVIDLANDRFVAPATGFYQVIADWLWETTAPLAGPFMVVTVGGTDTLLFRVPSPTAATAVFNPDGGYNAVGHLSLTSGDFVKLAINPRAVTGVTARGNALARLSTSLTLVRIT